MANLFCINGKKNPNGVIELGSFNGGQFYVGALKVDDLVMLYRIINSYHRLYEKGKRGNEAVFSKHLEIIKVRFISNELMLTAAIRSLEAQYDPNLVTIINELKEHQALQAGNRAMILPQLKAGLVNGYCQARVGAPNPSFRNCGYNSFSVVLAHTGLADQVLAFPYPKAEEEIRMITEDAEASIASETTRIKSLEQDLFQLNTQKARLVQSKDSLSISYDFIDKQMKTLKANTLRDYQACMEAQERNDESFAYEKVDISHVTCFKWERAVTQKHPELKAYACCDSCKKLSKDSSYYYGKLDEVSRNLEALELDITRKQESLDYLKREFEPRAKAAEQRIETTRTSMKSLEENRLKALETLQILRGEKMGALTEADTRNLCDVAKTFGIRDDVGYKPYDHMPIRVKEDSPGYLELRKALNDPNWRVIRIGGFDHWWAFVRNPDGKTVDTINDTLITAKSHTIDQIFAIYSNEEAWKQSQITFYSL